MRKQSCTRASRLGQRPATRRENTPGALRDPWNRPSRYVSNRWIRDRYLPLGGKQPGSYQTFIIFVQTDLPAGPARAVRRAARPSRR
ncbi:hypothetical protein GCM10009559_46670 [Pseudonocardia zijingensis]|uniref:Uncharacterized protein n=1 Tax=Pseudonocardia zijingensis TaxID=153376 RepID=A0ABN1QU89_9PSEU